MKGILSTIKRAIAAMVLIIVGASSLPAAGEAVEVIPSAPFDLHTIYQVLVLFWFGILGLVVILLMKLRELKRIQDLNIHKDDDDAPFLD